MVYAVQAYLGFRNAARRDGVLGNINTKFSTTAQYGNPVAEPITTRAGDPGVIVECRFVNQADQQQFWAEADAAFGTGVNGPVTGSRMWMHDCPHDQGQGACVIGTERNW